MNGATGALYEHLVERDAGAIPGAARVFLESSSEEDLWVAVTRFAVLAYAPSQHAKRAVMACRAAWETRAPFGDRWVDLLCACARYAAESRQPWSEPPILDPPPATREDGEMVALSAAIAAGDRLRAERWLSARLEDCDDDLRSVARGDALLMLDTAHALQPLLGEKGRYALLRMVVHELFAPGEHPDEPLHALVDRAIEEKGAVDAVRAVFVALAASTAGGAKEIPAGVEPYHLARDYAQTLIAHSPRFVPPHRAEEFLAAVHENLQHGESFADWSFA